MAKPTYASTQSGTQHTRWHVALYHTNGPATCEPYGKDCVVLAEIEAAHTEALLMNERAGIPSELCPHGIDVTRRCSICREVELPKADRLYRRTDGDVVRLLKIFPLDESIAYVVHSSPDHTYREGLRGAVSFTELREHYTLVSTPWGIE